MLSGRITIGPSVIAALVIVGFFVVIFTLVMKPLSITGDVGDILKVLMGTLGAKFGDVVAYHIGSSAGSRSKDDLLRNAQPPASSP